MVEAFNTQEFCNMVAVLAAEHWETVFTEEVITSLQSKYGMMEEDRNQAVASGQRPGGPYSVRTYLEALLDAKTWADSVCLNLISRLFLLCVSIVTAGEDMAVTRIRHNSSIRQSDVVVIYNGYSHYVPACKFYVLCLISI